MGPSREWLPCAYCGTVYWPDPNADGVRVIGPPTPQACPSCRAQLLPAEFGEQHILYCGACGGMLIEMRKFVPMIGALRAGRGSFAVAPRGREPETGRVLQCPDCGENMVAHPYGGPGNIEMDTCERCELNWLDRGEAARVAAAPDRDYSGGGALGAPVVVVVRDGEDRGWF